MIFPRNRSKKKARYTFTPFWFLLIVCSFSQCKHIENNWPGGLINRTGQYIQSPNGFTISVSDDNSILRYSVKNNNGRIVIKQAELIGTHQKWDLFWDPHHNLWVHSSDIGDFCWMSTPGDADHYTKVPEGDTLYSRLLPTEFQKANQ